MTARILAWIGALLLSAMAPALIITVLSWQIVLLPPAFAIALGHAVILGLPVALICLVNRWTGLRAAVAAGLLVGAIPGGLSFWIIPFFRGNASINGVPTVIDGILTSAGWVEFLALVGRLGGLGVAGSIVFWSVLKRSRALEPTGPGASAAAPRRLGFAAAVAGAAVIASIAVAAIPTATEDRTCHNVLRDGRRSINAKAVIELDIGLPEWPTLTTLVQQFGATHGMSFRNSNESDPGVVEALGLSVCTEQGVAISANEQRWTPSIDPSTRGGGVSIAVYDPGDGTAWPSLTRDFAATLESQWHGKVRFRSSDGRVIPIDEALGPSSR
jgi:hypothetical protein